MDKACMSGDALTQGQEADATPSFPIPLALLQIPCFSTRPYLGGEVADHVGDVATPLRARTGVATAGVRTCPAHMCRCCQHGMCIVSEEGNQVRGATTPHESSCRQRVAGCMGPSAVVTARKIAGPQAQLTHSSDTQLEAAAADFPGASLSAASNPADARRLAAPPEPRPKTRRQ